MTTSWCREVLHDRSVRLTTMPPTYRKPNILTVIAYIALGMMACIAVYGVVFKSRPAGSNVTHSPVAFDVTPDGKSLVVALEGGGLILIDRSSGRKIKSLAVEQYKPSDPALSSDGKFLVYSAATRYRGDCHLFLWEWQTANKPRQLTTGDCDSRPSFSRDGKRIAFNRVVPAFTVKTASPQTPYVINADGTNLLRPTSKNFQGLSGVRFSPDGGSLLLSGYEWNPNSSTSLKTTSGLFSLSLTSPYAMKEIDVSTGGIVGNSLAGDSDISRDGKKLVFVSDGREPYVYELYISSMPPSASNPAIRLHTNDITDYIEAPRFTPNGRRVLFLAAPRNTPDAGTSRGQWQIWEGDANGGKVFA